MESTYCNYIKHWYLYSFLTRKCSPKNTQITFLCRLPMLCIERGNLNYCSLNCFPLRSVASTYVSCSVALSQWVAKLNEVFCGDLWVLLSLGCIFWLHLFSFSRQCFSVQFSQSWNLLWGPGWAAHIFTSL